MANNGQRGRVLRIGADAIYAGDRIEPATGLARQGRLDYLVYETLAERTIALAQLERIKNPDAGYNELLADFFYSALPHCRKNGTCVVTNMGAANPTGAAQGCHRVGCENRLRSVITLQRLPNA